MGPLGVPEMIFIFVLALLILGPKKLPEVGRTIGKGMAEFKRASNELKSTFEREMSNMERESDSIKQTQVDTKPDMTAATAYDYPYDDYNNYSHESTEEPTPSVSAPQAAEAQPVPHSGTSPVQGQEVKS